MWNGGQLMYKPQYCVSAEKGRDSRLSVAGPDSIAMTSVSMPGRKNSARPSQGATAVFDFTAVFYDFCLHFGVDRQRQQ